MNLREMVVIFESAARSGEAVQLNTPFLKELAESLRLVELELAEVRRDLNAARLLLQTGGLI